MVLVFSRDDFMTLKSFLERIASCDDDKKEPKIEISSSLTMFSSPVTNSYCRARRSRANYWVSRLPLTELPWEITLAKDVKI
jgi:hypothetical protein